MTVHIWLVGVMLLCSFQGIAQVRIPDAQQVRNLNCLSIIYGNVRFYYPNSGAKSIDWRQFVAHGAERVIHAETDKQLADILLGLFKDAAPLIEISTTPFPPLPLTLQGKVSYWQHYGYADGHSAPETAETFQSRIVTADYAKIPPQLKGKEVLNLDLDGIWVKMPIVISSKEAGSKIMGTVVYPPLAEYERIATLIIAWNELVHFQPYISDWDNWERILNYGLREVLSDTSKAVLEGTLMYMVSQLGDAHGAVYHHGTGVYYGQALPPIRTYWVEGKLVITAVDTSVNASIGDVIVRINGVPAANYIGAIAYDYISAATEAGRVSQASYVGLAGPVGTLVNLECLSTTGKTFELQLECTDKPFVNKYATPTKPERGNVYELEPGLLYVNLCGLTKKELAASMKQLVAAKGILCELRCYPREPFTALSFVRHLATGTVKDMPRTLPVVYGPRLLGYEADTNKWSTAWQFSAQKPHIACPVIFLTNVVAQSYAETILSIVRTYKLGNIVGENTGGTNGVSNYIELSLGYMIRYTAMYLPKLQDGKPFYGVGIAPDVRCAPTIAGLINHQDVCLEKALGVLKAKTK